MRHLQVEPNQSPAAHTVCRRTTQQQCANLIPNGVAAIPKPVLCLDCTANTTAGVRPSGDYNSEKCYLSGCRFSHPCSECQSPHPATGCPQSTAIHGRPPAGPEPRTRPANHGVPVPAIHVVEGQEQGSEYISRN